LAVPKYQIHLLNAWGRIVQTVSIECIDDEEARSIVEKHTGSFPLELWEGERIVERYEGDLSAD
jgi:hypothetical protein